ncbi:hypothetical protein D3C81_1985550 [compost metagenome]
MQLRDLLPGLFQRAQGAAHGEPLQQQDQQQARESQAEADLLHALEALAHRGVVLGHADGNRLAEAPIVRTQHQQLLAFRAQLQVALQARPFETWQFLVPE